MYGWIGERVMTQEQKELLSKPLILTLEQIDRLNDVFESYAEMINESHEYAKSMSVSDNLFRLNLKLAFQSGWMAAMNYIQQKSER